MLLRAARQCVACFLLRLTRRSSLGVTVRIPDTSLLAPSRTAAVGGVNVLTLHWIVDAALRMSHTCAASQGFTKTRTFGAGGKDEQDRVSADLVGRCGGCFVYGFEKANVNATPSASSQVGTTATS
jgi:N-methylhydantoinase B/oxoprolinase/acetone carboxylase alpha subunit